MQRNLAVASVCLMFLLSCTPMAAGAETKPLDKETAIKLLGFMRYTKVSIAAVVQGIGGKGIAVFSGNAVATVIAVGVRNDREVEINESFLYDELGWFYYEFKADHGRVTVRQWTMNGYRELAVGKEEPARKPD